MRNTARLTWILALLVTVPCIAAAETFTVALDNGNTILTRYQPKVSLPDEEKVMLLTESGNWISIPRHRVTGITSNTESRGFGKVINTTTISLGLSPNEGAPDAEVPVDPTTALLNYLAAERAGTQRDYSVEQFVETEGAGVGGFPSNFGAGVANSGSPGDFFQPGSVIAPAPAPVPSGSAPSGDDQ